MQLTRCNESNKARAARSERAGLSIFLLHPCKSGALTRCVSRSCVRSIIRWFGIIRADTSNVMPFLFVDSNLKVNSDSRTLHFFITAPSDDSTINIKRHILEWLIQFYKLQKFDYDFVLYYIIFFRNYYAFRRI